MHSRKSYVVRRSHNGDRTKKLTVNGRCFALNYSQMPWITASTGAPITLSQWVWYSVTDSAIGILTMQQLSTVIAMLRSPSFASLLRCRSINRPHRWCKGHVTIRIDRFAFHRRCTQPAPDDITLMTYSESISMPLLSYSVVTLELLEGSNSERLSNLTRM